MEVEVRSTVADEHVGGELFALRLVCSHNRTEFRRDG